MLATGTGFWKSTLFPENALVVMPLLALVYHPLYTEQRVLPLTGMLNFRKTPLLTFLLTRTGHIAVWIAQPFRPTDRGLIGRQQVCGQPR
jgi:hypothetical protein